MLKSPESKKLHPLSALSAITNKMGNLKLRQREKGSTRQREAVSRNMPSLLESMDSLLNQYTVWYSEKHVCLTETVDVEEDGPIKCHAGSSLGLFRQSKPSLC